MSTEKMAEKFRELDARDAQDTAILAAARALVERTRRDDFGHTWDEIKPYMKALTVAVLGPEVEE